MCKELSAELRFDTWLIRWSGFHSLTFMLEQNNMDNVRRESSMGEENIDEWLGRNVENVVEICSEIKLLKTSSCGHYDNPTSRLFIYFFFWVFKRKNVDPRVNDRVREVKL